MRQCSGEPASRGLEWSRAGDLHQSARNPSRRSASSPSWRCAEPDSGANGSTSTRPLPALQIPASARAPRGGSSSCAPRYRRTVPTATAPASRRDASITAVGEWAYRLARDVGSACARVGKCPLSGQLEIICGRAPSPAANRRGSAPAALAGTARTRLRRPVCPRASSRCTDARSHRRSRSPRARPSGTAATTPRESRTACRRRRPRRRESNCASRDSRPKSGLK
jgi:hypothetical protein